MSNFITTEYAGRTYTSLDTEVHTDIAKGIEDFGFKDQKGRACGYTWTIESVAATPITREVYEARRRENRYFCCQSLPQDIPFDHFMLWGSPARSGVPYGPASNWARVATLEEAQDIIAKRIKNSRKRDAKKFAEFNKEPA